MRVATLLFCLMEGKMFISIHATHAGGDSGPHSALTMVIHFNPRHPCGWRPCYFSLHSLHRHISIHATHAGGDLCPFGLIDWYSWNFNPRHPCGWRLTLPVEHSPDVDISIHATHAGGDLQFLQRPHPLHNFNPRHPCGWRHMRTLVMLLMLVFQSTPPMRVATLNHVWIGTVI